MRPSDTTAVYLEIGKKRVFAGALDWPGWCRSGRDEEAALQVFLDYGPRYAAVLQDTPLAFHPPAALASLEVVERLPGGAATDFGAPEAIPAADGRPFDGAELARSLTLLEACWRALDSAAQAAAGKELRRGPRGGGRDLDKIVQHLLESDAAYLRRLAWKLQGSAADPGEPLARTRQGMRDALAAAARGELPAHGPRGGTLWAPRYFARRTAWHTLDHAWEIEDRIT